MKVTIEEIESVNHTVIWHADVRIGYWINCGLFYIKTLSHVEIKDEEPNSVSHRHIATALPPLPRNPTADDARLLHLYASHGLDGCGFWFSTLADDHNKVNNTKEIINIITCDALDLTITVITHAINEIGERVEIAIKD